MTPPTPVGFLDFFVLEASDYVEQLDGLLLASRANPSGPDAEAFQRVSRALRGSAMMAKLAAFSELAATLERIGRALRESSLRWDPVLSGAMVAAVDDCKVLLRNVRTWSGADEARARDRITELAGYVGMRSPAATLSPAAVANEGYLATETANIGAGLELLATRPADRDAAANVLRRIRALRGIASVKDHPTLSDVLEGAEQSVQPLDNAGPTPASDRLSVLRTAAVLLRSLAASMQGGSPAPSPETVGAFEASLATLNENEFQKARVVPVADLFFDDGGEHVVERAATPPTTPVERFRLEAAAQGEHLTSLVADTRTALDAPSRERAARRLRAGFMTFSQLAASFGEHGHAAYWAAAAGQLESGSLDNLNEYAAALAPGRELASPVPTPTETAPRPRASVATPAMVSAIAPVRTAPQERDEPAAAALASAANGRSRQNQLLDSGISKLGSLSSTPLSTPTSWGEQPPVPIDALLYRGRSAIERCVQIRDEVRSAGGTPDSEALEELFALLELALTD